MKSIIVGIYIAATALSTSVGPCCISAAATEASQEKNRKTRTRRLRRTNVVKVDGINEADVRREQQEEAMKNIERILNRSDDGDESTNDKRQLVAAGTISTINVSEKQSADSFARIKVSDLRNQHFAAEEADLEALFMMTQTKNVVHETLDDEQKEESDSFFLLRNIPTSRDFDTYSMPNKPDKRPTRRPTPRPTNAPYSEPNRRPTPAPFGRPTPAPFGRPIDPDPTRSPTKRPTDRPVKDPTPEPTERPTPRPTPIAPIISPTYPPTQGVTQAPMGTPTGPNPLPSSSGGGTVCGELTLNERQTLIAAQVRNYSGNRVTIPGTPQNQALRWLLDEDPIQVCPEDFLDVQQRYILAVLYFATNGDQWANCNALSAATQSPCIGGEEQRFLSGSDVCFWFGISCNRLRVSGISIDENSLRGELPEEIGFLEQIEDLDFDGELEEGLNFLVGSIPSTFGLLEKLVTLDLDSNELTGSIPEEIFDATRLTIMDLDSNELSGTLSSGFANLEELQILFLDNNGFFGPLPSGMGEMERLRFLRLDRNELSGSIPDEWQAMEKLRVMFLNNNAGITGTIPSYMGNFVDMQQLSLFDTGISGTVPSSLGQLTGLVNLFLHFTDLTGTMPQEICDLRTSGALNFLTADCAGNNPKLACSQPDCCTVCF